MSFVPVENFPHNQIIASAKIKISDLDDNLKTTITAFNRKHNGYKMKPTENTEKELFALSNIISQNIVDYYVDDEDQTVDINANPITPADIKEIVKDIKEAGTPDPVVVPPTTTPAAEPIISKLPDVEPPTPTPELTKPVEDPEPTNKNEKALFLLFKEGVTSGITKSMLKAKGFDTDHASIRGCRIGAYHLYKEFSETEYNLKKV